MLLEEKAGNINSQKPDFLFSSTKGRFWKQQKLCNEKSFDSLTCPLWRLISIFWIGVPQNLSLVWHDPFFPQCASIKNEHWMFECHLNEYQYTMGWECFLKNKESEPHDNYKYIYEFFGPRQLWFSNLELFNWSKFSTDPTLTRWLPKVSCNINDSAVPCGENWKKLLLLLSTIYVLCLA